MDASVYTNKWRDSANIDSVAPSTGQSRSVHMARANDFRQRSVRPRWGRQRYRLHGGKMHRFAGFINEVAKNMTDKSRGAVFAFGAGRAIARDGGTPAASTSASNE